MKTNLDMDFRSFTSLAAAGPVGVDENMQCGAVGCPALEDEVPIACGPEVSECAVKSVLVLSTGARGMLP
jgi:hypothetical protein